MSLGSGVTPAWMVGGSLVYVTGDATRPIGDGPKIIAHIVNDRGVWGAGFVLALSARSDLPEIDYRKWSKGELLRNHFKLGNILLSPYKTDISVCHMVAQEGFGKDGYPPIRYTWLCNCLIKLQREAEKLHATVHMPRIGCGLAGGEWSRVEPLLKHFLCDRGISVTVYDLPA